MYLSKVWLEKELMACENVVQIITCVTHMHNKYFFGHYLNLNLVIKVEK